MADMINNYELLEPFQNQNAGFSRWTTAFKNGKRYFLKEFMDPKYPDQESLKENLRRTRIKECEAFEVAKRNLYTAINKASDGNLTRITEFFRADSRYYLATEWIDQDSLKFSQIAGMSLKDKLLLCRTAAHSLAALHSEKIAHSDIKETNVLVRLSKGGKPVAKIIDFDSSFFEYSPPDNEDELGGDQVYLSPEACMFFCGEDVNLTCKMDVFALGLLFHQYMTGELPYFDKNEYDYAHEAVLDDVILRADTADIPAPMGRIIEGMLLADPEKRSSASDVYIHLTEFYKQQFPSESIGKGYRVEHRSASTGTGSSKLKMGKEFFKQAGDLDP